MWTNEKFIEASKKVMQVNPNGWMPCMIEYSLVRVNQFDPFKSVCFRIKGTNHTFAYFENTVNTSFGGDYKAFFEKVLEDFRKDFLEWNQSQVYKSTGWFREYESEYRGKIIMQ